MKYTSTSRTLSLIAHAIILAGAAFMGILFGFFVAPEFLSSPDYLTGDSWLSFTNSGAYFLWYELAVVGLVLAVISLFGFISAIKSLLNPHDDEPAVRSFSALICQGWIAAIFFLLQAALLWDLTANGNIVFVIVMALLIAIILLIATNIPMVKIFDQRDQTPLLRDFIGCGALVSLVMGLEAAFSFIGATTTNNKAQIFQLLGVIITTSLISAILAFFAWLYLGKNKNDKGLKVSSFLSAGSIGITGVGLLTYGIMDIAYQYIPGSKNSYLDVHLYNKLGQGVQGFDLGFGVMAIVLGSLLILGAFAIAYFANNDSFKSKKFDY